MRVLIPKTVAILLRRFLNTRERREIAPLTPSVGINRDKLMRAYATLLTRVYYRNSVAYYGTAASHSVPYLCKCSHRGLCPRLVSTVMRVIEFSTIFICICT